MARASGDDSGTAAPAKWITGETWLDSILDHPLFNRENTKGFITKKQLADFLETPEGTLDQWASRGGGPDFFGVGNHKKYWPSDVIAWLKTRRREFSADGERTAGAA